MITEDYISLKTARLLKDKGFRWYTNRYYNAQYDEIRTVSDTFMLDWNDAKYMKHLGMEGAVAIPTIQMAVKWLRLEHQIFIKPDTGFVYPMSYFAEIFCYGDNLKTQQDVKTGTYESPEEALEAAIKHCLENFDI